MSNLIIRDVLPEDVLSIKSAIDNVWCFSELVSTQSHLNAVIGLYLNQVLLHATFGRVALIDNEVVGVIFGSTATSKPNYRHLLEDTTELAICLLTAGVVEQQGIYEYFSKQRSVYNRLSAKWANQFDGCLDFLILTPAAQGKGVGKKLWHALKDYFTTTETKRIYLYSDTGCNTGFYDHNGFKKIAEETVDYNYDGHIESITNYLYQIDIT